MEPSYLSDLGLLTENKAIQKILCPMAAQLCHLILALEWEDGICQAFPNLGENAEKLAKATEELASVARRLAEESSDEVFKAEMCPAAKSLVLAGRWVLLATGKLQVQPEEPRHREELAAAANRVLTETAKVLRIEEAAGARRVTEAAGWLLERLCVLRDTEDVPGLLAAFGAFSEAMLLLNELTAKRLEQLPACPQRERLAQALRLLQQCVPRLHAAKLGHLQRACHQRGTLSEDYTFQLTERTITQLTSLLFNHPGSKEPGGRSGTFSQHVSSLLALLSGPAPAHLFTSELSTHVAAIIFHCMLLADSSRLHLKLELVRHCWVLLRLRKTICSRTSRRQERPGRTCGASGPREDYRTMREEVEALDQAALRATLCQILDTFVEGEEPLRKLFEGTCSLAGCFPAEPGGFLKTLQPLTAKFFAHAQQMLRTTDFVLARCTHTPTAREIGEQLECLRGLLASLPALLTELSRDGDARPSAAERLRSLRRAWAVATRSLLWCFDRTVGTREFLGAALREMAEHGECCGRALRSRDAARFSQHAARLASWARWVVDATSRFVDRATDPFFRNGLLVWVEQLAKSILELKAVAALCSERPSCLHAREAFSEALSCLLEAAQHIQDGLDGSNHPDILSPLRDGVRSTDVAMRLGLGSRCAGLKAPADAAALEEDPSTGPSSQPGEGDAHPVIGALLAATRAHDTAAIKAACSALLDLCEGCVAAAQEALPAAEPPQLEVLGQYQKILLLTPHVVSLAREQAAPGQLHRPGGLLQAALTLSTRIRETEAALAAVAGPWYSLSQQVLGFILSADLVRGKQALEETMMGLAGAVRLAGDIADVTCTMGNPISPDTQESFLQVQAKLSRAQTNTQALLERAASLEEPGRVEKASLEMPCVRWAVGMHVVLAAVDKFTGRDVLLLRELGSAVKNKLCSPSLLAAVSDNSLRLQEAARLSHLSCPEARGCSDILELREDIKVLTEALLDASNTLLASSLLTASLYTRFELLQRDLALRAKALLLHLEKVNTEHLQVIREVLGPALSPFSKQDKERSKQAFEEKASQLMANVCWVKTTLHDVLEAGAQENLLSVADHLVVLTLDAVGSASQLFQSHGGKEHFCWDSTLWYWSATAHYLSTQLRAVRGVSGHLLQLIGQRLRNAGGGCSPRQASSTATLLPAWQPADLSHYKPAETCPSRTGRGSRAAGEARETHQNSPPSVSLASSPAKRERGDGDLWQGSPSEMSQVAKDMATRTLHMTQFLRKKGPIGNKEQLVACARQVASEGQALAEFGRVLAKHCLDARCSSELLCAAEQTHTISSQLSIVARVKAVTAESKSSSELLVSNAQNLSRAVSHVLKAAEAACVTGLQEPPPDSEAAAAAAFCIQWRKNLLSHRARESSRSDRDDLGLRKTRARAEPTLMGMVQEQSPGHKGTTKASKPR